KPPTGEPYAGKPHVRFGGRGGESLPDPYQGFLSVALASSAAPPRDDDGDKGFSGRSFPAWRGEKHRMTSGVGASRGEGAAPCSAGSGGLDWRTGVKGVRSGWWARCLLATLGADMRYISTRGQAPA